MRLVFILDCNQLDINGNPFFQHEVISSEILWKFHGFCSGKFVFFTFTKLKWRSVFVCLGHDQICVWYIYKGMKIGWCDFVIKSYTCARLLWYTKRVFFVYPIDVHENWTSLSGAGIVSVYGYHILTILKLK